MEKLIEKAIKNGFDIRIFLKNGEFYNGYSFSEGELFVFVNYTKRRL